MADNLEHCIICLKQMESGFLDDDGVCIDCEEMEHDDQSDDTEKWHDFDPYCWTAQVQGGSCTPRLLSRLAAPRWAKIAAPSRLRWHSACRVLALDIPSRYDTLSNYQPLGYCPQRSTLWPRSLSLIHI